MVARIFVSSFFFCNWFIKGIIYVTTCGILLYRSLFSLKDLKLINPLSYNSFPLSSFPVITDCSIIFMAVVIQPSRFIPTHIISTWHLAGNRSCLSYVSYSCLKVFFAVHSCLNVVQIDSDCITMKHHP